MNEAPSRSRSQLDAVYAALPTDKDVGLADLVAAVEPLGRERVRTALAAARAGGVAHGVNGRWSRSSCTRTHFRDRVVVGALIAAGHELTFEQLLEVVPVSRPQLYTSLARLQLTEVKVGRDGSRTPRYTA